MLARRRTKDWRTEFYRKLNAQIRDHISIEYHPKRAFIVVSHALSDADAYIESFKELGTLAAVIPKETTRDLHPGIVRRWKQKGYPVCTSDRAFYDDPEAVCQFIKERIGDAEEFVIVDHGGYFAPCLDALSQDQTLRAKCKGIVDGSANGHRKYEKRYMRKCHENPAAWRANEPYPPYLSPYETVAKDRECQAIAVDTVLGIHTLLKELGREGLQSIRTVGIIGLGLTGNPMIGAIKGAAEILGKEITVIGRETSRFPLRKVGQYGSPYKYMPDILLGPETPNMDRLLQESDLIISCTGNNPFTDADLPKIKPGAFLTSITSANDELDRDARLKRGILIRAPLSQHLPNAKIHGSKTPRCATYQVSGTPLHVLLNGTPANYYLKQQSPVISMTHGLKLICVARLLEEEGKYQEVVRRPFTEYDDIPGFDTMNIHDLNLIHLPFMVAPMAEYRQHITHTLLGQGQAAAGRGGGKPNTR